MFYAEKRQFYPNVRFKMPANGFCLCMKTWVYSTRSVLRGPKKSYLPGKSTYHFTTMEASDKKYEVRWPHLKSDFNEGHFYSFLLSDAPFSK